MNRIEKRGLSVLLALMLALGMRNRANMCILVLFRKK